MPAPRSVPAGWRRGSSRRPPGATPVVLRDSHDELHLTALAVAITSMTSGISGTPSPGQSILVRIKDTGTARAIAWGAKWRGIGVTLPTTTVAGKTMYIGGKWNQTDSIIDVLSVARQA
jgi:hypothetical protein